MDMLLILPAQSVHALSSPVLSSDSLFINLTMWPADQAWL